MTKPYYKPPTPIDQAEIIPFPSIDTQDLEGEFCKRVDKLKAISKLFFCEGAKETRSLTTRDCNGLHFLIEDIAEELKTVFYMQWGLEGGTL